MRTIEISEAEARLSSLVNEVETEPFALQRNGTQIAFLVSPAEYATTLCAKRESLLGSLHDLQDEIEEKAANGEVDLEELMSILDRKAS